MTGNSRGASTRVRPLSVAILAGGESSRMGANKALLQLSDNGPTLIERAILATMGLTNDLFIVSRQTTDYPDLSVQVKGDRYPGAGVLGAICSALEYAEYDRTLVVSCDMPFLSVPALTWMADMDATYDALVPIISRRTRQGGDLTYQTLHAIYTRQCIAAIQHQLSSGNRKAVSFFEDVAVQRIPESQIAVFDPGLLTFVSVNTPQALQVAIRIEKDRQSKSNILT